MRSVSLLLFCFAAAVPAVGQLLTEDSHLIAQGFDGAPGERDRNDFFAVDLAAGDFDGDGFFDVAVGAPGDPDGQGRGLVTVFPGGPDGLIPEQAYELRQGQDGLDGEDERDDQVGGALAAGDFDNDGFWDLALGVGREDGTRGIVQILYGSERGLTGDRDQVFDQGDLEGSGRDVGDFFGNTVTVGDFNGDGFADLAVGSPGESNAGGVIHAIYGSGSGLTTNGNQRWRQDADGIEGNREQFDLFGSALIAGDFNGDGADDLAVGVPGEDGGDGGAAVLFGSPGGGLRSDGNLFFKQGEGGLPDDDENEDAFASILGAGDFNGDGFDELAIASIGEDNGRGVVIVLPGSSGGPSGNGSVAWRQGQNGLQDEQEGGDRFGTDLIAGDFNADGYQDLAVGVRGEDNNRGIVQVIYGSASGLSADGNQLFQQGFEGLAGNASPGDDFGSSLAVGNFGFDAAQDLVVGAPREEGNEDRGTAYAIYGDGLIAVGAGLSDPFVTDASYNSILSVFGRNFAPEGTAALGGLANGRLETNVGGVCIEMDGQRAPIFAAFPGQVNFQAFVTPDQRNVTATVVSSCDTPNERRSLPIPLIVAPASPEFFFFTGTSNAVAAVENNSGELLGAPGLVPGALFRRARVGDVVTVFMTGLGDTAPRFAPGELPNAAGATVSPVTVELGGRTFQPAYAGVTPGNAGLYQVSFVLDAGAPSGDLEMKVTVDTGDGPISTPPGAFLSVE